MLGGKRAGLNNQARGKSTMPNTLKPLGIAAVLSVVGAVGATSVAKNVHADDGCRHVRGRIQSTFTTTNCTSPVGLCTTGKITGAGPLDAATTFLALDVAPSAGLPAVEPAANLSYSGSLTINARRGTLTIHDLGVIDAATTSFTELERPVSGTGIFTQANNVFFISGSIVNNGTGFDGELSGELCFRDQDD
jgi:hypothetical protein